MNQIASIALTGSLHPLWIMMVRLRGNLSVVDSPLLTQETRRRRTVWRRSAKWVERLCVKVISGKSDVNAGCFQGRRKTIALPSPGSQTRKFVKTLGQARKEGPRSRRSGERQRLIDFLH